MLLANVTTPTTSRRHKCAEGAGAARRCSTHAKLCLQLLVMVFTLAQLPLLSAHSIAQYGIHSAVHPIFKSKPSTRYT